MQKFNDVNQTETNPPRRRRKKNKFSFDIITITQSYYLKNNKKKQQTRRKWNGKTNKKKIEKRKIKSWNDEPVQWDSCSYIYDEDSWYTL